jgi:hypothetical protein
LLVYFGIDRVFLLNKGRQSKADCQSRKATKLWASRRTSSVLRFSEISSFALMEMFVFNSREIVQFSLGVDSSPERQVEL